MARISVTKGSPANIGVITNAWDGTWIDDLANRNRSPVGVSCQTHRAVVEKEFKGRRNDR